MKRIIFPVLVITGFLLVQACTVQNHATTVERDKENACTVHVILQIGVDGTDSDVIAVREQLEECYSKKCIIPCGNDSTQGCPVLSHVNVKKWSSLSGDDKKNFHHITMVNNDGLPSNAYIGTANGAPSTGTWRRDEPPRTYCHEVLHLAGLPDQYCSRIYDTITHTSKTEVSCAPPPDPAGGTCCTATPQNPRCGQPCVGKANDIMATLSAQLVCSNIMDVIKKAGLDNCPAECCPPHRTVYKRPDNYIFFGPSYEHFGDKDFHYGSIGFTGEYTRFLTPKIGITGDIGLYFHKEDQSGFTEKYTQLNITAGITYLPEIKLPNPAISFSTHALFGISSFTDKYSSGSLTGKNTDHSFNANIGIAADYSINKQFGIRMLQLDYTPTFFSKSTQNNIRVSIGATYRF